MSGERVGLVITGTVIQLQACSLYSHAGLGFPVLDNHHVVPESWWRAAGLPVDSPMRLLCPSCHVGTHAAIDGLIRGLDVSLLQPRCVALARQGIEGADAAGLVPAPTL